jgi:hypothetical protein
MPPQASVPKKDGPLVGGSREKRRRPTPPNPPEEIMQPPIGFPLRDGPSVTRRKLDPLELPEGVAQCIRGRMSQQSLDVAAPCVGLVCDSIPLWAPLVPSFGGKVAWVCAHDGLREETQTWWTNSPRIHHGPDWESLLTHSPVEVVLMDSRGPGSTHPIWSSSTCRVVVWFKGNERSGPPSGGSWTHHLSKLSHQALGGVTDGSWVVHVAVRDEPGQPKFGWPEVVGLTGCTLGSVLQPAAPGRTCPSPGLTDLVHPSAPLRLRAWEDQFVVPCVLTPTRWAKRRLLTKEKLLALEFPAVASVNTSPSLLDDIALTSFPAYKVRAFVLEAAKPLFHAPVTSRPDAKRSSLSLAAPTDRSVRRRLVNLAGDTPVVSDLVRGTRTPLVETVTEEGEAPVGNRKTLVPSVDPLADAAGQTQRDQRAELGLEEGVTRYIVTPPPEELSKCLDTIRHYALRYWKRKVCSDFWLWHKARRIALAALGQAVDLRTAAIGITSLCYATDASLWDWDHGSAPFFWRWPSEFLTDMRDGIKPRFIGPPPAYRVPQRLDKDPAIDAKIRNKMLKLLNRGYLDSGTIDALMNYFAVSKGLSDIRMVFDGTKSGLNDSLWAPWFALPNSSGLLVR